VRWLVAAPGPYFSVQDVYTGWCEALEELGETVVRFPLGDLLTFYDSAHVDTGDGYRKALAPDQVTRMVTDRLAAALYKVRPQVLLSVSSFFCDENLLDQARAYGTRVVLLHTESPYEEGRQLALAPHADLNLLNDPTHLGQYEPLAPTVYVPHAYRPKLHHPASAVRDIDFAFVGTGYPSRTQFLGDMDLDGLAVALGGNWMRLAADSPLREHLVHDIDGCLDNDEAADLYRRTKVGLNLYRREAESDDLIAGWSMGPREVEMAACGLFFLRDRRPEGDEVLDMLPTFEGPEEASELLRYWLARDDERERLAAKAAEAVADRTFTNHAAALLRLFQR
jgi:spore maturation protein CgeB